MALGDVKVSSKEVMHHSWDIHTHLSCWGHEGEGIRPRVLGAPKNRQQDGGGWGRSPFQVTSATLTAGSGVCESTGQVPSLLSLPHIWHVLSKSKDTYRWPVCSDKYIVDALSAAQEDCLLLFLSVGRWWWHRLGDPLLASALGNVFLKNQFSQARYCLSCQLFRRITNFLTNLKVHIFKISYQWGLM